jgi:hypothetical protein
MLPPKPLITLHTLPQPVHVKPLSIERAALVGAPWGA